MRDGDVPETMRFEFELSDIRVCDWPQVRTRVTYSYMSVPCFSYVSTAFLRCVYTHDERDGSEGGLSRPLTLDQGARVLMARCMPRSSSDSCCWKFCWLIGTRPAAPPRRGGEGDGL